MRLIKYRLHLRSIPHQTTSLTGVSTERQKCTSVLQTKRGFFSNKRYYSYKCWTWAELCEAFTFLMEKICAFWKHGLSTNSGNSHRHKLCSTHGGFVFVLLWEGFMFNLHKSKQYDLIDMLNDMEIIDNPEFEKHISGIYPTEFLLNKANTSDKETSFLDLNIRVIGSDVHTGSAFTPYAMTLDFLSSISPGWVLMFLDSHRTVFTFLSWFDLPGVSLSSLISILNIFKLLPNYWHRITAITSSEKHLENSSGNTLSFYKNLMQFHITRICFWMNLSPGLLRWSSLRTKEGKRRRNFISSGSKIVNCLSFLNHFVWLRITEEGSVSEMRIWPILLIKTDLKCYINLVEVSFSYLTSKVWPSDYR